MLSETDLVILIEAMDSWIDKGSTGELMGDLFMGMLTDRKNPEVVQKMQIDREGAKAKREAERAGRMEVATLLKAKLIQMKRDAQSREYTEANAR